MTFIGSLPRQATTNVFTGKPCDCGHGGMCNCPSPAAQRALPYLVVPRDPQPAPIVRTEVDILRERNAALEAKLAALTPAAEPAANPLVRGLASWPGAGGVDQRTGKPRWV